jgi:hypothetical protein
VANKTTNPNETEYILRGIPDTMWARVRARAALERRTVRSVMMEFLEGYAGKKQRVYEKFNLSEEETRP